MKFKGVLFSRKRPVGEAQQASIPTVVCEREGTKPAGCFRENPRGGGSFAGGRRWLGRCSPLWGCAGRAALATTKIPPRRTPFNSQTGSQGRIEIYERVIILTDPDGTKHSAPHDWFKEVTFK